MSTVFVCNVYDPSFPDADRHLVSENYGERCDRLKRAEKKAQDNGGPLNSVPSKEYAQEFMKKWISKHSVGEPQMPDESPLTLKELKSRGIVGLYIDYSDRFTTRFESHVSINNQG